MFSFLKDMDPLLRCGFYSHGPYGKFQYLKLYIGPVLSYYL